MRKITCEICGDLVDSVVLASTCTHTVYLCEKCKKDHPGALELCTTCEILRGTDEA